MVSVVAALVTLSLSGSPVRVTTELFRAGSTVRFGR